MNDIGFRTINNELYYAYSRDEIYKVTHDPRNDIYIKTKDNINYDQRKLLADIQKSLGFPSHYELGYLFLKLIDFEILNDEANIESLFEPSGYRKTKKGWEKVDIDEYIWLNLEHEFVSLSDKN